MSIILEVNNLSVQFGGLKAVENFQIEINDGELVGLIGPNGAGKTTVFNLLTGVYQATNGDIFIDGKLVRGKKPHQISRYGLARTFQNIRLFKKMSVIDNVKIAFHKNMHCSLPEAILRLPRYWKEEKQMDNKAKELLAVFGLENLSDQLADNLPYGQQRKLEIARALATQPKILLLDEPAAGMNPTETQDLMNTIKFIRDKFGVSVLLIEHDMNLVMGICERIVVLDYGNTIAMGTPAQIAADPKVIGAYLGS
ncbi:MAG: ABC transporter ATP-binding protein [Bacillota bacterium]|nr:ABC transporter ATP-binding protein [Bacillota bacterium]